MIGPWMPTSLGLYKLAVAHARALIDPARIPGYPHPPDTPSAESGYYIVEPAPVRESVTRGHGRTTSGSGRFHVRCYGASRAQAALVMDEITAAFRDWKPYPDRPRFGAVERIDADEIGLDKSVPTAPAWLFLLTYDLPDD